MVRNYKRKTEDRWSKEDLLEALTNIKEAKLKINDAARQYRISRATLYRQFKKFLQAGGKCDVNQFRTCGGNPILTKVEEDVLEKTIRDLREQGFTVTSSDIKRICFEYCDSNGIPNQFNQEKRMASDDWYYGFLKRHPDVRIGDGTTLVEPVAKPKKKKKKSDVEVKAEPSSPSRAATAVVASGSRDYTKTSKKSAGKRKAARAPKRSAKKTKLDSTETVIVKQEEAILDQLEDERGSDDNSSPAAADEDAIGSDEEVTGSGEEVAESGEENEEEEEEEGSGSEEEATGSGEEEGTGSGDEIEEDANSSDEEVEEDED